MKIFNKYFWYDLRYKLSAFFKPRQKWLTKKIPKTWCDKTELIKIVLFEMVVNFVEEEDGISMRDYDWAQELANGHVDQEYIDHHRKWQDSVADIYRYIKKTRPELEAEIDSLFPPHRPLDEIFVECENNKGLFKMVNTADEKEAYSKIRKLEEEFNKKDLKVMKQIVDVSPYLWT